MVGIFQIGELGTEIMKKTEIILISIIIVVVITSGNQIYQDNLEIDFLQDALATKTLHYEWLSEIMDSVLESGEIPDMDRTEIIDKT